MPKYSSRQGASFDMRLDLFRSICDPDLGWHEVKVTAVFYVHRFSTVVRCDSDPGRSAKVGVW